MTAIFLFIVFLVWFSPLPDVISVYFINKKRGKD